jgi:hypothetical protein
LLQVPLRIVRSQLFLNRADLTSFFSKSEAVESISILSGSSVLAGVKVIPSDEDCLELTPSDAAKIKIDPATISVKRSAGFLKTDIRIEHRGREIPFLGSLVLTPRQLFLNPKSLDQFKLPKGSSLFVAANTLRTTIFGNVQVNETNGSDYVQLSLEEGESAGLKENDLVYVVETGDAKASEKQNPVSPKLPERFLQMDLILKGRTNFVLITERHVWQAIRMKKKIWVPKNARLTPAAKDLGNSRKLFEFEL